MDVIFIRQVGIVKWAMRNTVRKFYQHVLHREQRMRLPSGSQMILPCDPAGSEIYITKCDVDWGSEALLFAVADRGGCLLDVGANIGYYAMYGSPWFREVYAFEPDPRPFAVLVRNAALVKNVFPIQKAVGDRQGRASLAIGAGCGESAIVDRANGRSVDVPIITLDAFASALKFPVSAVKVDVEGLDLAVVKGAADVISRDRPILLVEFYPSEHNRPESLAALLKELDLSLYAMTRPLGQPTQPPRLTCLSTKTLEQHAWKMLMLVPREKEEVLEREAVKLAGGAHPSR